VNKQSKATDVAALGAEPQMRGPSNCYTGRGPPAWPHHNTRTPISRLKVRFQETAYVDVALDPFNRHGRRLMHGRSVMDRLHAGHGRRGAVILQKARASRIVARQK